MKRIPMELWTPELRACSDSTTPLLKIEVAKLLSYSDPVMPLCHCILASSYDFWRMLPHTFLRSAVHWRVLPTRSTIPGTVKT